VPRLSAPLSELAVAAAIVSAATALLGDSPQRDYARKLRLFNAFAAPELRTALAGVGLQPGMRVLEAGCGCGETLGWLAAAVGEEGLAVGFDLSAAHAAAAREQAAGAAVLQADLLRLPLRAASFDMVVSVNTVNHLRDPLAGIRQLKALLRGAGRLVLGQSSFLPDMYFAWDARLERLTNEAVRRYYRERYELDERQLSGVRSLLGLLQRAGLQQVGVRSLLIERVAPLSPADEAYLLEVIFRGTWGERLRGYLSAADFAALRRLCDPGDKAYALRRPDFHFLQSFTLAVGRVPP
jgi:SAM-dependent methyltransferase